MKIEKDYFGDGSFLLPLHLKVLLRLSTAALRTNFSKKPSLSDGAHAAHQSGDKLVVVESVSLKE